MTAGGFDLGPRRRSRRVGVTPLIDVVFLLLVFFMLAARFGSEARLPLALAGAGAADAGWVGPPRLVDVAPGALWLNGLPVAEAELTARLLALGAGPKAPVVVRPRDGADLQRLVAVLERLGGAGLTGLLVAP